MKIYKKLAEHQGNGYIVTVHTSPDCPPETLIALGEMMGHLIKQIEGRANAEPPEVFDLKPTKVARGRIVFDDPPST